MKLIVAHATNRLIGAKNTLPWRIPAELKFFKDYTLKNPNIVFGRKTYDSLKGRKLVGRNIHVLSRGPLDIPGVTHYSSIGELLSECGKKEFVVAGGQVIYEKLLPYCNELVVSEVFGNYEGDAYFPDYTDDFIPVEELMSTSDFKTVRWVRK